MDILPPAISAPPSDFVRTLVAPASAGSDPRPANSVPPSTPKPAHRNLHIELSRQQLLHRFSGPQRKGQAQLVWATAENVAHRRGCLMRCQSRNRRSSPPLGFQRPSSFPFHHPHPAAHCTSSYPEDSSHLSLRKTSLNCLNDSSAKIFLSFC